MKKIILTFSLFITLSVLITSCGSINKTSSNYDGYNTKDISRGENQQIVVANPQAKEEDKENNKNKNKKKKKDKDKDKNKKTNSNNSASNNPQKETPKTVNGVELSIKNLEGEWILYSIYGKTPADDNHFIADEHMPYFIFEKSVSDSVKVGRKPHALDGYIYANDGCNTLNSHFIILDNKYISMINPLSTQRYCTTQEAPYEYNIKYALDHAKRHTITQQNEELYLNFISESGSSMMTFKKVNINNLDGIWKITKINDNSSKCKKGEYIVSIDTYDRKIHGQLPCNIVNGSIIIDATVKNSVTFQNLASTRMTCPDQETETEILIALESVYNYKRDGKKLFFYDKNGKTLLELTNITNNYKQLQ